MIKALSILSVIVLAALILFIAAFIGKTTIGIYGITVERPLSLVLFLLFALAIIFNK